MISPHALTRCRCGNFMYTCEPADGVPAVPKPGDITLCEVCGEIYVFDEHLAPRLPTPEESPKIQADPWIGAVQQMLRTRRGHA